KDAMDRQFPTAQKTYVTLTDGTFCGGSLMLFNPKVIDRVRPFVERVLAARKKPWLLAQLFGWAIVLRFASGRLSIAEMVARATISEDVGFMRQAVDRFRLGKVETLRGAAGGVRYLPLRGKDRVRALIEELCQRLRDPTRLLPGGFLYTSDLTSTPRYATELGEALAGFFDETRPDVVLTMEVKGIPLALMTARAF